jgi:hypothetical protein
LENVTDYTKLLMTFNCVTLVPDLQYNNVCPAPENSSYLITVLTNNRHTGHLREFGTYLQLPFCTLHSVDIYKLYFNCFNVNFSVPCFCISTSVLQGTVYIPLLLHPMQYTTIYNNLRCCLIHDYLMYILPDYDSVWIDTCWSLLF